MGKVIITLTCDWDGLDYGLSKTYNPNNEPCFRFNNGIKAIEYFNFLFENKIPITHFICPVYFSRSGFLTYYYSHAINKLVRGSNCEIGLHIHCWKSLMEKCRIRMRDPISDPDIPDWGITKDNPYGLSVQYTDNTGKLRIDYGHGVPLGVYEKNEIIQLLVSGRDLLVENKTIDSVNACVSFRCGGWLTCDKVFDALQLITPSFKFEASAVDASYFKSSKEPNTLDIWLSKLWGDIELEDLSYLCNKYMRGSYPSGIKIYSRANNVIHAQPAQITKLIEMPDTAILADYVGVGYMENQIDIAVQIASKQIKDVYLSLGFHIESGGDPRFGEKFGYIERIIETLNNINKKYTNHEIEYLTIANAGEKFLSKPD